MAARHGRLLLLLVLVVAACLPLARSVAVCTARFQLANASQPNFLNLGEVSLLDAAGQQVPELARTQSSCWLNNCTGFGPQAAADGDNATFCATATADKNASMSLSFDCDAGVEGVKIINRLDFGASRLAQFNLAWLASDGSVQRTVSMRRKGVGRTKYTVSRQGVCEGGAPAPNALPCQRTAEGASCTVGCALNWVGSVTASCYDAEFTVVSGRCRPAVCWVHIRLTNRTLGPQTYLNVAEVALIDAATNGTIPTLSRNMSSTWARNMTAWGVQNTADNNLATVAATAYGDRWPAMSLSFNCIEGDPVLRIVNRVSCCRDRLAAFSAVYVNSSGAVENAIDLSSLGVGLATYEVLLPDPCASCPGETACAEASDCDGTTCLPVVAKQDGLACSVLPGGNASAGICRAGACIPGCFGLPPALANTTWQCANGTSHAANCSASCDAGFAGAPTAECRNGDYSSPVGACEPAGCDVPPPALANTTWQCANGTSHAANCSASCDAGFAGAPTAECRNGNYSSPVGACEPAVCVRTWSYGAEDIAARGSMALATLSNGDVLIAGGRNLIDYGFYSLASRYSPSQNGFIDTPSMAEARVTHSATAFDGGRQVLVAGGAPDNGVPTSTAEVFNATSGTWSPVIQMVVGRRDHAAALVTGGPADGSVLLVGGYRKMTQATFPNTYMADTNSAEVFNGTGFTATGAISVARHLLTATALPGGKVLVAGGEGPAGKTAVAEMWENGVFTRVADMPEARFQHSAIAVLDGAAVLVLGGSNDDLLSSTWLYNVSSNAWTSAGSIRARYQPRTVALPDGTVVVCGGYDGSFLDDCSAWHSDSPTTWKPFARLRMARWLNGMASLGDGRILVVGGQGAGGGTTSTELYSCPDV